MEQQGEYLIAAPRAQVWAALNDPDVLGACITGCQSITRDDDTTFQATVKAKIGPVSATFNATLNLTDLNPPESYVIEGGVKGGAAGFGKGQAHVQLQSQDNDTATLLTYTVTANVGGKLAQIGSRLVDGAARKMADEFFSAFREKLQPETNAVDPTPADDPTPSADAAPAADPAPTAAATPNKQAEPVYEADGNGKIWLIAFAVLVLAMLLAL